MLIDEQKIMSRIKGSPYGVNSVFVKLDEKWAIKLYQNGYDRDEIYENQKQAAKYELGPEVGEKIDFNIDCWYPYGYITEIVEVLISHEIIAQCGDEFYDELDKYEESEEFNRRTDILFEELKKYTGIDYHDLHAANIGVKNGKYILIDFGTND